MAGKDTTYQVMAERLVHGDTVIYQVSKPDLQALYLQAYEESMNATAARTQVVLGLTYIPLIILFLTLITIVNIRWNRAFKRLRDIKVTTEMSPEAQRSYGQLELQYYEVGDRVLFYLIVWIMAFAFDALMMLTGMFNYGYPFGAALASVYTIKKIIARLVGGSALRGKDDDDLRRGFEEYSKRMIIEPLTKKLVKFLDKEEEK